ncbi:MAG: hypothetical protein GF408_06600 [Candidatus Omnitrophica bacterium]|nr:hypothetical protein [Candidatus Omnitrophota bacterium]
MKKCFKITSLLLITVFGCQSVQAQETFSEAGKRRAFAKDISGMMSGAWKRWQDGVVVNGVEVDGARGTLNPGDLQGVYFTSDNMMGFFEKEGKPRHYTECVKAVALSVEKGMRAWQKGYSHPNIPFPQGASCSFTLTLCNNVPVTLASGRSLGRQEMTERELYGYMLYRLPGEDERTMEVLKSAARAISDGFSRWERTCSIVDLQASGGIAPRPAPMGPGPGPVRGAKANNGKLSGPCFDAGEMYRSMVEAMERE